jgi:hypothetical protein
MMEYKEIEVIVSINGYEVTAFIDVPPNLTKEGLFRFILDSVELDYDDDWARS